nr:leucine-rich repeat domain-containing protein [Candidatus Sigynarchaeota archaeon]
MANEERDEVTAHFRGVPLVQEECDVLIELEADAKLQFIVLKPDSIESWLENYHPAITGFFAEDGHVVELCLIANYWNNIYERIQRFHHMRILQFSIHSLDTLPSWIGNFLELKTLIVVGQPIIKFPEKIGIFPSLERLVLTRLASFPGTLAQLPQVKYLRINASSIPVLPDSIGEMKNLIELDLGGNGMSNLPLTIGEITSLKVLNISRNQLTALPDSIGDLLSLKHLVVDWNKLTELPESIGRLANLKELSANHNKITSLPDTMVTMKSLETLLLAENGITTFPFWLKPYSLPRLRKLDLSNNKIKTFWYVDIDLYEQLKDYDFLYNPGGMSLRVAPTRQDGNRLVVLDLDDVNDNYDTDDEERDDDEEPNDID